MLLAVAWQSSALAPIKSRQFHATGYSNPSKEENNAVVHF